MAHDRLKIRGGGDCLKQLYLLLTSGITILAERQYWLELNVLEKNYFSLLLVCCNDCMINFEVSFRADNSVSDNQRDEKKINVMQCSVLVVSGKHELRVTVLDL